MKSFIVICEEPEIIKYLLKRSLLKQYKSSKNKILKNNYQKLDLKQRNPKGSGIWSFRINKQFRVIGYERENKLIIVKIDNHQ